LIRLLLGLLAPDARHDSHRRPRATRRAVAARRRRPAYLPQNPAVPESRFPINVRQVARLGARWQDRHAARLSAGTISRSSTSCST
jgi:hypothetical protein